MKKIAIYNSTVGTLQLEYEDLQLPDKLYARIETAYENLCRIR